MELDTEYGKARYDENRRIYWAELSFWDNWPKLAAQCIIHSESPDGYVIELFVS